VKLQLLRLVPALLVVLGVLSVVNCGPGGNTTIPVGSQATPPPTPIPIPSTSPVTVVQQQSVVLPAAIAGVTSTPVAVALPTAAGFAPTMLLPLPQTATNAQLTALVSNVAPSSAPPLSLARFVQALRRTAALPTGAAVLLYTGIYSTATLTLPIAPGFTFTIPAADVFANANYFLALYDPTRPSLGWQYGFEGPATVTGTALAFAPNPAPFTLAGSVTYYFALYVIPQASVQPTPAPSVSPTSVPTQAPPTPSPTSSPSPTPSPSPSSTSGNSVSIVITVPTPAPVVCSPAAVVLAVGQTLPVSCSEAVYGGTFQLVLANPALAIVTVPTPAPVPSTTPTAASTSTPTPAQTPTPGSSSAPTPTPAPTPASSPAPHAYPFTVTGVQAGTTTLSVTALDGGVGRLTITVTP
jgi:hypothetical protein